MIWTSALLLTAAIQQPVLLRKAEASILPPEPLPLGGYTQRKEVPFLPGGDDLKARVLELEQGKLKVAIVSVEMLTVPQSLYREVKKRIPNDIHLFLTATHTHCAPDSQMLNDRMTIKVPGIALFNKKWLEWYAHRISESVRNAIASRSFEAKYTQTSCATVPLNRPRRKFGTPDSQEYLVNLVVLSASNGVAVLPAWYSFAAHPTIYDSDEMKTRGDWPGRIAAKTSALVLQGAIGDISPQSPGATAEERINAFVHRAMEALSTGSATRTACEPIPFVWEETPIALDPVKPHPNFAKDNHIPEALANIVVKNFAPTSASISAFRLGKIAVVGVPGEPSGALGWRIRNYGLSIGFNNVFVVSHVNGWIGYILEPDDYDRGGYEATLGFHGRMTGERIVDAARKSLNALANRKS